MDNSPNIKFDGSALNTNRHPDPHDLNSKINEQTSAGSDQGKLIPVQNRPVEIQIGSSRLRTKPSKLPVTSRKPSISPSKFLEKPHKAQATSSQLQDKSRMTQTKTRDIQKPPEKIQARLTEVSKDSRDVETSWKDTQSVPSTVHTKSSIVNDQPYYFQTGQSKTDHQQSDVHCVLSDVQADPSVTQAKLSNSRPSDLQVVRTDAQSSANAAQAFLYDAEVRNSCVESMPGDVQVGPSNIQVRPSDVPVRPGDVQLVPSDSLVIPIAFEVKPSDPQIRPNNVQTMPRDAQIRPNNVQSMPSDAQVRPRDVQDSPIDSLVILSEFLTKANDCQVKSSDLQANVNGVKVWPSYVQDLPNNAQDKTSDIHIRPSNVDMGSSNIQGKHIDTHNRHSCVVTKPCLVDTRQNVFQTAPSCHSTEQAKVQTESNDFQVESSCRARQNDMSEINLAKRHDVPLDIQAKHKERSESIQVNYNHVADNAQARLNAESSKGQMEANRGFTNQNLNHSGQSEINNCNIEIKPSVLARQDDNYTRHGDVLSSSSDFHFIPCNVHTTMCQDQVRNTRDFQNSDSNFQGRPNYTSTRHNDVHCSVTDVRVRPPGVQRRYSEAHINPSDFQTRYSDFQCRLRSLSATSSDPSQRLLFQNYRYNSKMDDMAGTPRRYGSFSSTSHLDSGNSSGPGQTSVANGLLVSGSVRHVESMTSVSSSQSTSQTGPGTLKRQKSYYTPSMVDELRKRNRLFFVDPITKLRNLHGFPWKLSLQVVKLVLITVQIVIFGGQRENTIEYFERSSLTYKHLLLKDWEVTYETLPYPPAAGQYAIYRLDDLFDHMNAVMERYYKIPEWSLASIHHNADKKTGVPYPISLCFRANDFIIFPNGSYIVSASVLHNCTDIHPLKINGTITYDVQTFLKQHNFTLPFNRTLDITLSLYLQTFHLNLIETHYGPTCYNVSISIVYTNRERSGQMLMDLDSIATEIDCEGKIMSEEAASQQESMTAKLITFDAAVMAICVFSTLLCSRSLHRCNKLRQDTAEFFRLHKGKPFSFSTHMEYINMWYLLICCNDVLTVVGSAFKIELETREFSISSENYEICSILLGLGVFLTYIGILRYLGFFKSYNILILTVKTSFPHVLRFLVCAICLFSGFMLCGWVVFSPYHIKFRGLSTAAECLFSLVNGDDMFVTYSALNDGSSDAIWYFHRAYLYIFIALFIYVVISVFIAVIMENYENLKRYYAEGFPDTEIQKFIKEDGGMPLSEVFRHVNRENKCHSWFFCLFPCLAWLRRYIKMDSLERDEHDLSVTL